MSKMKLPAAQELQRPSGYQWDIRADVLERWAAMPLAAEADDPNTISIYDVIGVDPWTGGGFTAKRMAAALRTIGNNDVTVSINSPGGDLFEGIAIYNLLRKHQAKVTVSIVGIAASAASIIAMAGDRIEMGLGTFMMVHNAWGLVIGNRHDMRDAADLFEGFDTAITDVYVARTGLDRKAVEKLMDAETFMGPSEAIEKGFADVLDEGVTAEARAESARDNQVIALRRVDAMLAKAGVRRSERRTLLNEIKHGTQDAAEPATQDAGALSAIAASLQELRKTIHL